MRAFSIIFVAALLLIGGCSILYYNTSDVVEITVTDKERIVESNGETVTSKFLVYTETDQGVEVFENRDDLWLMKFNSRDVQAELERDGTYVARVYGWRIPFLSMHRNIIDVKSTSLE